MLVEIRINLEYALMAGLKKIKPIYVRILSCSCGSEVVYLVPLFPHRNPE